MPSPEATAEYAALGITEDTWACIAALNKAEAGRYLFAVAGSGVPVRLSRDADGKRWHVAVKGGLLYCPAAFIASLRGEPTDPATCSAGSAEAGQHPQATR